MKDSSAIENLIMEMGFTPVTGNIYKHPDFGVFGLSSSNPKELAKELVYLGMRLKQNEIKSALGLEAN